MFLQAFPNISYYYSSINVRRSQVIVRRNAVKQRAFDRKRALQASKDFHNFAAEADDLSVWLDEKTEIAKDDSFKELKDLPRKLQKHKAFERELRANEGQLRNINKDGEVLISSENHVAEVVIRLEHLNNKWKKLLPLSEEKGRQLEQALLQREHNRSIEDAKKKVEELQSALKTKDIGDDLRSCKHLINEHQLLTSEIAMWEQKIIELVHSSEEMIYEGHFNAQHIRNETKDLQLRFKHLQQPLAQRQQQLEESLFYHKFVFDLDAEFQWIRDHLPAAKSTELGQNLHQTQSLFKKHKKYEGEINGHQYMIDKAVNCGQVLIGQKHLESAKIVSLCNKLKEAWSDLLGHTNERTKKLELALKAQQYLSD